MATHTPVRVVSQGGGDADTCDTYAARARPDWGAGLGIKTYGDLEVDTGRHARTTEIVHLGPFLRWLDRRFETHGRQQTIFDLGWNKSDERRLHRWRFANVLPFVPVATIEDALHHAGVRLVEVYPETDVGEVSTTWCPKCKDAVVVDEGLICPWCDTPTATLEELYPPASVTRLTKGSVQFPAAA